MKATHTYALLEVTPEVYAEIRAKLEAAGYQHAFLEDGAIDMHGIAITRAAADVGECPRCPPVGTCVGCGQQYTVAGERA